MAAPTISPERLLSEPPPTARAEAPNSSDPKAREGREAEPPRTAPAAAGRARGLRLAARLAAAGLATTACIAEREAPPAEPTDSAGGVVPGIEVLLADSAHLLSGLRLGLITNQTGISRDGRRSIDLLASRPDVDLVALFSLEHGLEGTAAEGERIPDAHDEATGLPIWSLYGWNRRPSPATLEGLDALLFDVQDIGTRYYTYVSSMAYSMEEAGRAGLRFIVLDRPNPIGGLQVQGPVLDPAFSTFVGLYPVPVRHGMTAGELARLYVGGFGIEVDLSIVPARGWRREAWFEETKLPWVPPSPNMPSVESATHYPGTCLFEGTNLSVGRGTPIAFQHVGAPWLDGPELARRLEARGLPGVRFVATRFTPRSPTDGKYPGEEVSGVRFEVMDRSAYDPVIAGVAALLDARALAGDRWEWNVGHFDRLAGNALLRPAIEAGTALDEIVATWQADLEAFRRLRTPYLIY